MKKYLSFCLILTFLMLCGCSNYQDEENTNSRISKAVSSVTTNTLNDYFYTDDVVLLRADAKYSFEDLPSYETKKISAKMYKVKTYNNGTVC